MFTKSLESQSLQVAELGFEPRQRLWSLCSQPPTSTVAGESEITTQALVIQEESGRESCRSPSSSPELQSMASIIAKTLQMDERIYRTAFPLFLVIKSV